MKRIFSVILVQMFLFAGSVNAGELKEIELTDGSILTGEVVSLNNGLYTIRTESVGTVTVPDGKVKSIHKKGTAPAPSASSDLQQEKSLQERMMSDKEVMGMIESLKDDPDFQKALEDPEIMKAVQAGDFPTLLSNQKFMQLMNNASVQAIRNKVDK